MKNVQQDLQTVKGFTVVCPMYEEMHLLTEYKGSLVVITPQAVVCNPKDATTYKELLRYYRETQGRVAGLRPWRLHIDEMEWDLPPYIMAAYKNCVLPSEQRVPVDYDSVCQRWHEWIWRVYPWTW